MENKYITVAYRLYAIADGKKELLEEATVEHPFQFISGIGYTLDKFEKEITFMYLFFCTAFCRMQSLLRPGKRC